MSESIKWKRSKSSEETPDRWLRRLEVASGIALTIASIYVMIPQDELLLPMLHKTSRIFYTIAAQCGKMGLRIEGAYWERARELAG